MKIDGCGAQRDIALWYGLFNQTLRQIPGAPPMLLENCHDDDYLPDAGKAPTTGNSPHYDPYGELWCPFHLYRTSGDAGWAVRGSNA